MVERWKEEDESIGGEEDALLDQIEPSEEAKRRRWEGWGKWSSICSSIYLTDKVATGFNGADRDASPLPIVLGWHSWLWNEMLSLTFLLLQAKKVFL